MGDAAHAVGLWWRIAGARSRAQLQYRTSFWLLVVGQALSSFVDFLALIVLFTEIDALAGWKPAEIALLYGMASTSFHLADQVIGALDYLPVRIREGSFDSYLLRPAGSWLQLTADGFALRRIGKLFQAVPVLVLGVIAVEDTWSVADAALLAVSIISGSLIFTGIWTFGVTICFWVIDGREFVNAFTYGGNFLANQPIEIYARWLQRFVTFFVPVAFVNYFPAVAILDKAPPPWAPGWVSYAGPAVALAALVAASSAWRFAVRHYRSTGT